MVNVVLCDSPPPVILMLYIQGAVLPPTFQVHDTIPFLRSIFSLSNPALFFSSFKNDLSAVSDSILTSVWSAQDERNKGKMIMTVKIIVKILFLMFAYAREGFLFSIFRSELYHFTEDSDGELFDLFISIEHRLVCRVC